MTAAWALHRQRTAGNAAVAGLLFTDPRVAPAHPVQRCGPARPDCECGPSEQEPLQVQRNGLEDHLLGPAADPFDLLQPPADLLEFTDRSFQEESLPTVCPRCHGDRPAIPQFPRYVDREATEERLVSWAVDAEKMLHSGPPLRKLQLGISVDTVVEDYGVGLIRRITSTHEFKGSDGARERGAAIVRQRWAGIRPAVRESLVAWYQAELFTAIGMTPRYAVPVLDPEQLNRVLTTRHGGQAPLGRWGAVAVPGQKYGIFEVVDIGEGQVWFHLSKRPLWLYAISFSDFAKHDPFIATVTAQVYDQTKWIQHIMPLLLKVGAFGLGFSGSVALVITSIVLDELAEEMKADVEGRPGRSPEEILGSAGVQLLVDRVFHGLFGGSVGRAAAATGRVGTKVERIVERAVPGIRRALVRAEEPLVRQAIEAGSARRVTDSALLARGYTVEVAIEAAGQRHVYRLGREGTWCRFSTTLCDLDLGSDIATAVRSPASFTKAKLEDTREALQTLKGDMEFLGKVYARMRAAGKMDVSLLSDGERRLLDELAPDGDAATLTLRELRDLPRELELGKGYRAALEEEARLVRQLYREGRPLYEIMRAASPSHAARARARAAAGGRDVVTGVRPRSGSSAVDHVVPLSDIVRMPGFDRLRPERQLDVVNDVKNLCLIDALANASRGDRSWWTWNQAVLHYDAAAIARMRALEDELRAHLQGRIQALLRP